MDPAFEAANAACLPILEAAGIGEAGSEIAGSGTIVIAGPDGADLPVLEAFPKP
jgi:hypothetical protein